MASGAGQGGLRQSFSASQPAGAPVRACPLKCNLKTLTITEPNGGNSENKRVRGALVLPVGQLNRLVSPTQMPNGHKFQITANSRLANEPRELKFSVASEKSCPGVKHPLLIWQDSSQSSQKVTTTGEGKYFRQDLACDKAGGFLSFLNGIFALNSTKTYILEADSCGKPVSPQGIPVPRLMAVVEVFPGDEFEAELKLPAASKSDLVDHKTDSWTTERDRQGEEIKKEGDDAAEGYKASSKSARAAWGSESDYRKGFEDHKKEQLGYEDRTPPGMTCKLTQKDGGRTAEAQVDDIIKLYKLARSVEAKIKAVKEWIEDIQIGPGASLKIDMEIFVVALTAKWGYQEYSDDRVFLGVTGMVSIEVIKGSLEAFFGFRSAGLADVLAFLKGEGALKITGSVKHDNPDEVMKPDVAVAGEFKVSGGVQGQAMWIVKAEGKLQTGFTVELSKIKIFQETALLKGEVEIKLAALQLVLTASCMGYGSKAKSRDLTKEHKWPIPIGEG